MGRGRRGVGVSTIIIVGAVIILAILFLSSGILEKNSKDTSYGSYSGNTYIRKLALAPGGTKTFPINLSIDPGSTFVDGYIRVNVTCDGVIVVKVSNTTETTRPNTLLNMIVDIDAPGTYMVQFKNPSNHTVVCDVYIENYVSYTRTTTG